MDAKHQEAVMTAARALVPVLAARAQEMEDVRRLPSDLAQKMAEAGIFRMAVPAAFGGMELPPRTLVEVVEILSEQNASAGWCAMIAATTALNAAYMEPDFGQEIYGDPMAITGGVFAPMGKAVAEGDHYRVSGRWQWGSGSAHCTWLCGGCTVWEEGDMVRLPNGAPDIRMMVFPASEAELHDTWQVMGLKGTGSGDIEVKDILVPKGRSVSLISGAPLQAGPLYKFPPFGLLALGVSAVALGNARGALNAFRDLAVAKKSQGSSKTLSERQTIQVAFADAEVKWRAARGHLYEQIERAWDGANASSEIPMQVRADLRLACTHVTRTGAEICRTLYDLGGGAALFEASPLQRHFRDAHAATQHIVTAPSTLELTGRVLLGLPTDGSMI